MSHKWKFNGIGFEIDVHRADSEIRANNPILQCDLMFRLSLSEFMDNARHVVVYFLRAISRVSVA